MSRVKEVLNGIIEQFKTGNLPEAIAYSSFPRFNIPSNKWSLLNKLCMLANGTKDARGFKQWLEAKRAVKKGAKAFFILAPRFIKRKETEAEETPHILTGFLSVPVFKAEDTEGDPLEYENLPLPELPLMAVARDLGIEIKTAPGNSKRYAHYSPDTDQIVLCSPEEIVFYHELSHAIHKRILGELIGGQDWRQEIVAELSAEVICRLMGEKPERETIRNTYDYVSFYAESADPPLTPLNACLTVLSDVEQIINYLRKGREEEQDVFTEDQRELNTATVSAG